MAAAAHPLGEEGEPAGGKCLGESGERWI